jgi:hypothetical protein
MKTELAENGSFFSYSLVQAQSVEKYVSAREAGRGEGSKHYEMFWSYMMTKSSINSIHFPGRLKGLSHQIRKAWKYSLLALDCV